MNCKDLVYPNRTHSTANIEDRIVDREIESLREYEPQVKDTRPGSPSSVLDERPYSPGAFVVPPHAASTKSSSKTPRLALEPNQRDWVVENFTVSDKPLKIDETKMNHNVFVRDCKTITLQVEKKINNLTAENCSSVNIVVDNVISSIELIRCQKCQIQVVGKASALTIDNCQGINVYVSFESRGVQITSSQNAEVNLHVPESQNTLDTWVEIPIPCQFVHSLSEKGNILDTKVSDLYR